VITSSACWADMAFEGRPGRPAGTSVSSTTFLFILSRAIARRMADRACRRLRGRPTGADLVSGARRIGPTHLRSGTAKAGQQVDL
jgi:hypothetical protein